MRAGRPRRSGLTGWALIAGTALLLAGCAAPDMPQDYLSPVGPIAKQQDALWNLVFPIAAVVFFIVQIGVIFIVWRFRTRDEDTTLPKQLHGNTKLELVWTIIPALILAGIAVPTVRTLFDLSIEPDDALQVRVVGKQFWWEFEYLGDEGRGVITANELHIPTNREVWLSMEALSAAIPDATEPGVLDSPRSPASLDGVIHSFWVPKLAGKQDVVPGHIRTMRLRADEPGVFSGQCAEFCGIAHALMRFTVVAQEPDEFDAWLSAQAQPAVSDQTGLAAQGRELFETAGCINCHAVSGYTTTGGSEPFIRVGPNLTHFASRTLFGGALFEVHDREQLAAWLRDPTAVKQGAQMPNLGLSEEEIQALVAYLLTLN